MVRNYWKKITSNENINKLLLFGIVLIIISILGIIATNDRKEAIDYCVNHNGNSYEYCYEITK